MHRQFLLLESPELSLVPSGVEVKPTGEINFREAKARATIIKGTEIAERERVVVVKETDLATRDAACRAQENTIAVETQKLAARL